MIDPSLIIAQAKSLNLFKNVGGAAQAAALIGTGQAMGDGPNAYVIPTVDEPDAPRGLGGAQAVKTTFGLLIMVRTYGDATGAKATEQIETIQPAVHAGFLGWEIPGFQPVYWRSGRLLHFEKSALWWLEEFTAMGSVRPIPQMRS